MLSHFRLKKPRGTSASKRAKCIGRPNFYRPMLEPLEDRRLLALIVWDGEGATDDWNNAANWAGDALPGATDDAQIGAAFAAITVTHSTGTTTINSVDSAAGLTISGGSFSIAAASLIDNALTLSGGELTGAGTLTISGSTTWTGGNMTGTGETITNGALAITGNNQTVAQRTLTINGGATLGGTQLLGQSGGVIINNSLFDIQSDADLLFNSGAPSRPTFINAAGGTVRKSAGAGDSIVTYIFNNSNTVEVNTGTLSLAAGGTSSGSFSVAATLDFGGGTAT